MPKMKHSGAFAWIGLAAGVLLYDTWAMTSEGTTMSTAFRSASRHPQWWWAASAAWAVTTLHLYGALPKRVDPFNLYSVLLSQFDR